MKNLMIIISMFVSATVLAHPGHGQFGPCKKAGMTKAKRQLIKQERKEFRQTVAMPLRKEVKEARKAYIQGVTVEGVSDQTIEQLSESLANARAQLIKARKTFVAKLAIAQFPKNIKAGIRCLSKGRKGKGRRHGHRYAN